MTARYAAGAKARAKTFRVRCSFVKPNMSMKVAPGKGYLMVPIRECVSTYGKKRSIFVKTNQVLTFIRTVVPSNSFTAMASYA